jgi:hypothetical protein
MPFKSKRAPLILSVEEKEKLTVISKSRTEAKSAVERAKILLGYTKGETVSSIAHRLHANRPKVERCIDKALHFGALTALHDLPRQRGFPRRQEPILYQLPKELGFAQEFWTLKVLTKYLRDNYIQAGHL